MENNLPKGWTKAPLKSIADARMGETILAKELTKNGVPVYSAGQDNSPWGFLEKPKKINSKGTIVVSARGSIGFPKIPANDSFASTQTTIALKLRDEKLTSFCCLWLKTVNWNELTKGGAIPMLTVGDINKLVMPLPPDREREKILSKLRLLLPKVKDAQSRLDKIPLIIKRLRQSIIEQAFANIDEEDLVALGNVLPKGNIFDGPFGSDLKTVDYTSSGVRVIRLENIGRLKFIEEKKSYISNEKYKTLLKHTVYERDIIFASFIADEIRVCVLPKLKTKTIAKADCFCVRPDKNINPEFLAFQLTCNRVYDLLVGEVHGVTRPRINTTQLKKLMVYIPPIKKQMAIVQKIKYSLHALDHVEQAFNKVKAYTDKLEQSILAKAFRGELVS